MSYVTDLREIAAHLAGVLECGSGDAWTPSVYIIPAVQRRISRIAARTDIQWPAGDPSARDGKWHRVCNVLIAEVRAVSAKLPHPGDARELPLGDAAWFGFMQIAGVSKARIEADATEQLRGLHK
jgi:hypothetical protein